MPKPGTILGAFSTSSAEFLRQSDAWNVRSGPIPIMPMPFSIWHFCCKGRNGSRRPGRNGGAISKLTAPPNGLLALKEPSNIAKFSSQLCQPRQKGVNLVSTADFLHCGQNNETVF